MSRGYGVLLVITVGQVSRVTVGLTHIWGLTQFFSIKQLEVLLLLPGWDASQSQGYLLQYVTDTYLYTWVKRKRDSWGQSLYHRPSGFMSKLMLPSSKPLLLQNPQFFILSISCVVLAHNSSEMTCFKQTTNVWPAASTTLFLTSCHCHNLTC